jgi:thiazole synthase ThiGH ThiG subunit
MTEWINYHSHNRHLFVPPTEGGRPVTEADRIKELEARVAELEWALLETIAEVSNHLPDSAKQHNLQVAIKVLKRSESFPSHEAISNARSMLKESDQ